MKSKLFNSLVFLTLVLFISGCICCGSTRERVEGVQSGTPKSEGVTAPSEKADVEFTYYHFIRKFEYVGGSSLYVNATVKNKGENPIRAVYVYCKVFDEYGEQIGGGWIGEDMGDIYPNETENKEFGISCDNIDHVNNVTCEVSLEKRP